MGLCSVVKPWQIQIPALHHACFLLELTGSYVVPTGLTCWCPCPLTRLLSSGNTLSILFFFLDALTISLHFVLVCATILRFVPNFTLAF